MSGWVTGIGGIASLASKLLPSSDKKLGKAEAENEQYQETREAEDRMDQIDPSSESDTIKRLRSSRF